MGYELYIVRLDDYTDGDEDSKISLDEWLAYVATDKELELTNGYNIDLPGVEVEWQNRPGFCNWLAHPKKGGGVMPWFDYGSGCISAKYPDSVTIKKMITMAVALNARVHGDDFEYYDETYFTNGGYPIKEPQEVKDVVDENNKVEMQNKKPWWKFW